MSAALQPAPLKPFVTTREVAQLLDVAPATMLAKREDWSRDLGFPDPMPTSGRPLRWRSDMVLAWISEQGLPRAVAASLPPRPAGTNIVLLEEARRA